MAYTATVSNKRLEGRNVVVDLTVALDGKTIETQVVGGDNLTNDGIAAKAKLIIASHASAVAALAALTEGAVGLGKTDAYESVAVPFFAAQQKLAAIQKATAEGLLKGSELADAEVAYKEAYADVESGGFMERALTDNRYKR